MHTFTNQVATDGILSETDTNSIITEISSKDPLLKEISFKRFEGINREGWYHDDGQYGFSFNVSKSVMLTGIGLYLPLTETDKLSGLVEIYDESHLAHKQDVQLEHDLFKTNINIPLWKKISVKPKRTYSVRQRLKQGQSYNGINVLQTQCIDGVAIEFMRLQHGYTYCDSLDKGLIHSLTFEVGM